MAKSSSSYLLESYGKFFFRMTIPKNLRHLFDGKKELKKAIPTIKRRIAEKHALVYAAESLKLFTKLRETLPMADNFMPNFSRLEVAVAAQSGDIVKYKIDPNNMDAELAALKRLGLLPSTTESSSPALASPPSVSPPEDLSSPPPPPETPPETLPAAPATPPHPPALDSPRRTSPQKKDGHLVLSPNLLLENAIAFYLEDRDGSGKKYLGRDEDTIRSLFSRMLDSIGNLPLRNINYYHADRFRDQLKQSPKVITTNLRVGMNLFELIDDGKLFQTLYDNFRIIVRDVKSTEEEYRNALSYAPAILEKLEILATEREATKLHKLRSSTPSLEEAIIQFYDYTKQRRNRYNACERLQTHAKLLDLNTVAQRLTTCSTMFKRLNVLSGGEIKNPFYQVSVKRTKSQMSARQRFTSADLTTLFNDPIWTAHKYNHTYDYWLPLLLLFTGARIAEILQLEKKDIRKTETTGIWYISVNNIPTDQEEDIWAIVDKSLKTLSSERCFPIHPKLLELGFLDFCDSQSSNRIFEYHLTGGTFSTAPSRRFNEFILDRVGIKTPQKVLYSFRHTALDILKQNLVHMEIRSQLAGHVTRSTTGDVYGEEFQVNTLLPVLMLIDLNVELQNVKPWVDSPTIPPYHAKMKDMMSSFHKYQEAIFVAPYIAPFALRSMSSLQLIENTSNDSPDDTDLITDDSDVIDGEIVE